jgi:hypothetical protein
MGVNQSREIMPRAITHNVMIVRLQVFYRAFPTPFLRDPFFSSDIGVEYKIPAGSSAVAEMARCVRYCKEALA